MTSNYRLLQCRLEAELLILMRQLISSLCRAVYHQHMNGDLHHVEQQSTQRTQRQQCTGCTAEDPRQNPVGHHVTAWDLFARKD